MWSNELELIFIKCFRSEPILWDAQHRNYKDKSLNHDAWNRLGELMEIAVPELRKKKESLFASYRKYRKMVKDSYKSGADENEIYKPKWFAFDALDSFLNQGPTPRLTINTTSNTDEPSTSGENTETTQTRNYTTRQTNRPRFIKSEVNEAGKYLKEALCTCQENIKKRESTAPPDDCDIYGTMLAKKLRAFTEIERLEIMYDIDGLIINRRRSMQQHQLSSDTFIPSPPTIYRPSSSMSSYSEPLPSERVHRHNTHISCSEPTQINILQGQNTRQPPIIHISGQNKQHTSGIIVDINEALGHDLKNKNGFGSSDRWL